MKPISLAICVFCFFAPAALADRLITTTEKVLEGKVSESGELYRIEFSGGAKLDLPKSFVKEVQIEGDMAGYVPKDEKEKEMLAKGFVRFKGQWIQKDRYEIELKKDREAARKKFEDYKAHQDWGNEWKKETKHFFVHCNVSPEILDSYAETYEHFFENYAAKFKLNLSAEAKKAKMEVNIFKSEKDYLEYSKMKGTAGYFAAVDQALYLFHDHNDPLMSKATLFHEGTHMINFMINPEIFPAIPLWLEESIAEYFSYVRYEGTGPKSKIIFGEIAEHRLGVAQEILSQEGTAVYLQKIFTTPYAQYDADFYALGWSLVYFLFNHAKYGPGFTRFCQDIYQGKGMKFEKGPDGGRTLSNDEATRAFFKYTGANDIETLEKEWIGYVVRLKQPGGRGLVYRALTSKWDPQPPEGKGRKKDALEMLNKAIDELGFQTGQAYYLRAQVHEFRKDKEKAVVDLERAIAIDPVNDRYYAARAWFLYQEKKYAEAESSLRLAMALDPSEGEYEIHLEDLLQKKWKTTPIQKPTVKQ